MDKRAWKFVSSFTHPKDAGRPNCENPVVFSDIPNWVWASDGNRLIRYFDRTITPGVYTLDGLKIADPDITPPQFDTVYQSSFEPLGKCFKVKFPDALGALKHKATATPKTRVGVYLRWEGQTLAGIDASLLAPIISEIGGEFFMYIGKKDAPIIVTAGKGTSIAAIQEAPWSAIIMPLNIGKEDKGTDWLRYRLNGG